MYVSSPPNTARAVFYTTSTRVCMPLEYACTLRAPGTISYTLYTRWRISGQQPQLYPPCIMRAVPTAKVHLRRIARLLCVCNVMRCGALLAGRFLHVALYHLLDLLPHTRAETDTEQRMMYYEYTINLSILSLCVCVCVCLSLSLPIYLHVVPAQVNCRRISRL